jgi:hypothetical protein
VSSTQSLFGSSPFMGPFLPLLPLSITVPSGSRRFQTVLESSGLFSGSSLLRSFWGFIPVIPLSGWGFLLVWGLFRVFGEISSDGCGIPFLGWLLLGRGSRLWDGRFLGRNISLLSNSSPPRAILPPP